MNVYNCDDPFEDWRLHLSLFVSEFLELIPLRTKLDKKIVKVSWDKRYRYYIDKPKLGFDIELGFPYLTITYRGWKTTLKKFHEFNSISIERKHIVKIL